MNLPVRTINDVVKSQNVALSAISRVHGELVTKALLTLIIDDVIEFFSIGNSMSDNQLAQTIDLILEEYYFFKPDDFVLCFKNAKKGIYGKVYNRVDGMIIFEWLEKYAIDRQRYFASINEDKSQSFEEVRDASAEDPVKLSEVLSDDSNIKKLLNSKR